MADFQYRSLIEQKKMALSELQEYFRFLRKAEYERQTLYDLKIRKRIYFLIKLLLKIDRVLNGRSLKVIANQSYQTNKGKIYVCTSSSEYDVPNMVELAGRPSWTVQSRSVDKDINESTELLLKTNFLTFLDYSDKDDLIAVEDRLYRNLSAKGTEICFPEMSDLKTADDLVAPLDDSFVKRLVESRSEVIPVALMEGRNSGQTLVNIGKNLEFGNLEPSLYGEVKLVIRAELTTLKEEIASKRAKKLNKKRY